MSPDDYGGVIDQLIQFNTGDINQTHTITIAQDLLCEDDPNEFFFSNIAFVSGTQPIEVIHPQARVIIDDSMEPECGKQGLFSMNNNGSTHLSLVPLIFRMEATQKAPKQSARKLFHTHAH